MDRVQAAVGHRMSLSGDELRRFAAELAADRRRWSHLVHHAGDIRVFRQIWDDEEVNAWVICWSEDQDTGGAPAARAPT
jgi:hypothetical protein